MYYNVSIRFCIFCTTLPFLCFFLHGSVQAQKTNPDQPAVIRKWDNYRDQVLLDSNKQMVELGRIPGIVYDLRYATTNNFMHRLMYPAGTNITFLRQPAVNALEGIQKELREQELGLKIFDAYRPFSVTVLFWELVKDERYVANPAKGSGHNRGTAVDLTLINAKTGKELDMGTGFDNFSDTAHHSFTNLPPNVLANRQLLKNMMEKYGFRAYADEWWHYSIPTGSFELLDIDFKKLLKPVSR